MAGFSSVRWQGLVRPTRNGFKPVFLCGQTEAGLANCDYGTKIQAAITDQLNASNLLYRPEYKVQTTEGQTVNQ